MPVSLQKFVDYGTKITQITKMQQQELSRRLKDYEANPQAVISWQDVREQALSRAKADR